MKSLFENAVVFTSHLVLERENDVFIPHASFPGVYLKHLVTGDLTNHIMSCHLVKIDPFHTLFSHVHKESLELHEVIQGSGSCIIGQHSCVYEPGNIGVIPANTPHEVTAGPDGLYLLAKFTPSLI